jgi:hypothetical protein
MSFTEEFMAKPEKPEKRNHKISVAKARELMGKKHKSLPTHGGHFPKEVIESILKQPGCEGIRFYYGGNADGSPAIVLVGIDASLTDMTDGELVDDHVPCPPFCGGDSALR